MVEREDQRVTGPEQRLRHSPLDGEVGPPWPPRSGGRITHELAGECGHPGGCTSSSAETINLSRTKCGRRLGEDGDLAHLLTTGHLRWPPPVARWEGWPAGNATQPAAPRGAGSSLIPVPSTREPPALPPKSRSLVV